MFCLQRRDCQLEAWIHRNMRGHMRYKVKQKEISMYLKDFIS